MQGSMISFALEGARLNAVLTVAIELGLSEYLTDGPMSVDELAAAAEMSPRGAQVMGDAMVAMKIWRVDDDKYGNTPISEALLLPDSPNYVGEQHAELLRLWAPIFQRSTELVKSGSPANPIDSPETIKLWSALTPVLARTGRVVADIAVEQLELDQGAIEVLDIGGGGEGLYSAAVLRANPDATATQMDWPQINDLAQAAIDKAGNGDRFKRVDGDFHDTTIEANAFDVVCISHILHQESYDSVKQLLGRAYAGLRSGGRIVIADWIVDDGRTGPAPALLFNFTMLLLSDDGKSYEKREVFEALEEQGFRQVRAHAVDNKTMLVFAEKP